MRRRRGLVFDLDFDVDVVFSRRRHAELELTGR
jgi:hypothetical protein